jgi:hypothetical protein
LRNDISLRRGDNLSQEICWHLQNLREVN